MDPITTKGKVDDATASSEEEMEETTSKNIERNRVKSKQREKREGRRGRPSKRRSYEVKEKA